MTEKYIPYKYNGEIYDIPESKSAEFEKHYPSATIEMHMDGEIYDIPLAHKQEAIDKYGSKLTYAFEKDSENTSSSDNVTEEEDSVESLKPTGPTFSFSGFSPMGPQTRSEDSKEAKVTAEKEDEGPSIGESFVKGAGAGFTRTGKGLLGALHWLSSGYTYNDPETGEAKRTEDYDTQMRDETNTLRNAYVLAGETADRLSKEADPTGGEKGFVDLISEGKLGTALQKGVATMAESLPMTLSAYNPYTMALNFVSMAADNYGEETLNNPDIDPWKRGVYAIGTAAFEQAVEKFADPVFKYIGGGKGAGKITEEMSKEIMEKGTKDAVKNIAKRIFQALGRGTVKTLKDAGGEGLEEIVTSLGTDALGSALDAIDGNDDYGFSAQWKQYKAEHPNADRMAFAEKKAKEYVDAFLGGALSGGYMSGPLNVASETSMFISDSKNMNQMQEAREKGATLGLANMYDLNDVANEQVENAAKSMVNENGETMLSREFISTLSSDEAYAISRSERLSPQQKVEFQQLANAKAMQEGLRSKLDSDLENNVNAQKVLIEHVADNGIVVAGFVDGNPVYVKGGVEKNGAITLPNGENGPVIVINALTGEQTTINSNEIQKGVSQSAEEYSTWVEGMLRDNDARNREVARNTMSPRAKLKAVTTYVGKKMYIDLGGGIIEVGIQNVSPESGTVLIKGKKGDLGGQSMVTLNASTFYDSIHRDDDGNPMLAEGEVEVMDEMPAEEEAPVADEVPVADVTGDEDFREHNVTILIDGVPTNVYVTSQDNTSDSIVYEYEDANGNKKSGSSTVGAFKGAMQQAEEYKPDEPTAIEGVEADVETPSVPEEPAPVETAPQEVPVTPETIDWDMLFDNDPETFFTELQNQFGEDTADVINDFIATAEEELASLEKKKGKTMNDRIKDLQRKSSLKLRIGTLYNMLDRLKSKSEPVVATSADTPAEKEGEFIFEDGDVKNPLVLEMPDEEGTTNKIFLAEKDGKWGSAAYVVLDDGNESGTPRIQIQTLKYDTKEDAIKAALSYFDFYKNMKKDSPSTKTDAFVQYIKDTYLPKEATAESEVVAPTEPEAKVETPAPVQQAPVAPTKVADPIRESQKKEKHLATQLKRYDLSPEQKQDMAFNVGKSVADMFATREEYEAYAENATDLGDYNADFERGVDESFANRHQNVSDSPVNSIPLENEPKVDNNGEANGTSGKGPSVPDNSGRTTDEGGEGGNQAAPKVSKGKTNKGKAGKKVAEKYPARKGHTLSETDFRIGGEGMKGFYDKMLPAFMNKYGKKWGVKVEDIELPNLEEAGRVMHSVPVTDSMKDSVMDGQVMFMKRPNGKVYGWTDGKKIYLTKAGINPNTPVHEYTHLWAKAMMQKNPKGWNSIKSLLKGTPIWDEVINDPNYSDIKNNEDAVTSEVLSRISGSENAAKLEKMAQQMIDEAKGTARKLEARGLIQNIKDALNKFWNWVGTELFGIENFESVEQVTDRVLWDLMNKTDLGELSEGQVEAQIVTDPKVSISNENSVSLPNVSQAIESGAWNDAAINELNKIAEDVEEGKAILKRYTSSELTGLLEGGRLLVGASIISRGSERNVSASRGRAKSLEEKAAETIPAITAWAKSIGAWRDYSERTEDEIAHSYITSGGEAQVFYLGNGKVEKIIGLDYFVDPQLAIDRIAIHNSLFEETQLRVTGFGTNKDGQFAIIVEQPTIIGKHTDNSEIDSYIESIGFKKVDDTTRTFANEDLYLSDLHEENVLNQNHERYYVIDGDFRLNTAELGVGGNREIDDSIVRVSNETESRKDDIQNAVVDFLVGPERNRVIERAVNEEAAKLGVKVTYKTRSEMPKGHENDKGYYNTKTGEIVICTENASSVADAIQTILHEAVAHKGLRQLIGDRFNEFINRVYDSLDAETKAKVDTLATEKYDGNTAVATEEYIASLAETEDFANNSLWDKIKSIFEDIINAILGRNDIKIGDNELRYILRASYANMVNPRNMDTIEGWAKDKVMREEYKINEATPEIMSRTGIDPTEIAKATAAEVYANHVSATWNEFQRQFQDAMQPVRVVYDAIQQETGNVPIEDYENYILVQNQSSSRSRVEIDNFQRKFYSPIIKQVNALIDKIMESRGWKLNDEKKRSEVYKEVRQYLIAKHGLERNKYYQEHKMRHLKPWEKQREIAVAQSELDAAVEAINSDASLTDADRELQIRQAQDVYDAAVIEINEREIPDLRDYSGLTALFGMDEKQFEKAEEEAAALVENFEKDNAEMTEELWKRINKATDKTLRHSYECGLISRQQYNDIKGMFNFYIPLRGFDETTAEDVYSYARFEGNRFNPAVHKTGGRTSLADDPIVIIMNMAESEIAQGNKNRAKQALYNFILNRPVTGDDGTQKQNSLMQIESVWYLKSVDESGNEVYSIASPNRERGETYEEFEARMQEKAENGEAMQSKKGKVDVGLRFQKPSNVNAHYIYLKVNGVEKAIYVNGDPKAAEAVNGTYKSQPSGIESAMRDVNRFLSSTFTNYSLEFTVRNYFRDMVYSHINIDIKEKDPAYRKKFRKNWRHNNLKSMVTMLKAYRAGEFEGRELNEDEAAFVEFMENGGQTGYTLINSVENRKRDLERAIKKMQGLGNGGVKDSTVFRYTLGAVELLNEASELVTRFAAFKTSRDMGRSVVRSISDAKEITVNFNTKGAQDGKGIFGFLARYLGWSKYFFNASVQGVQNIAAMAKANKLKFCSVVGGMAAWGLLMPVIVSAISEMLGGDDDEYWNIPEYDRQNNFCVPVGNGMYAKIPLPIGFREMYALGDMVAAMAFDKKFSRNALEVGTDMANKIASIVLPINPLESMANGLSAWHTMLYTALPSSAQFLVQNMSNVDWKGSPLQKEYTYNENDPAWMKAFENNPAWMKGLSKWCNEHIDLNDDYKGMDWSPEKLDNTLSNLFGGIYTLIKKTGNSFSMIWNEENRNLSNVPMAGVFLGSGIDNDDRFVVDAYFEQKDYYDQRVGTIKTRAKQFGYELDDIFEKKKGRHHPKIQEIYANDNFEFMQEWYKGNKELEKLNKDIQKLELKIAEKENPSESLVMKLNKKKDKFLVERREFVNKMLEID